MVVLEVSKNDFMNLIGKEIPEDELSEVLFLLKVESIFSGDTIECELNPDRPDMFSVEGLARAVKGFLGFETGLSKYQVSKSKVKVERKYVQARPFIACAIIRNINLMPELVKSLMQIQEKLHDTIGRGRKKVAIGVHDFDKVKEPFVYDEFDPKEIEFVPLDMDKGLNLKQILEHHPKGKDYAHLLEGFEKYPVILDAENKVLSFPPIINGELTRVTENTKNLFIDVTGTDERAISQALNVLVCNVLERGGQVETVTIITKDGRIVNKKETPSLDAKQTNVLVEEINKLLGLELKESEIAEIFERMRYGVIKFKGGKIDILVPPYRVDVMHKIDLVEDVAIGYGYNNFIPILPKLPTIGGQSEIEKFSRKIRELMIGLGFQEIMNFVLTNKENNFKKMLAKGECVEIKNPVSEEYNICRTWLLPSLLKVLSANKHVEYPQKIFEIGDCVILDQDAETETKDARKLAGAISYDLANLTEMKSVVETILGNLDCKYEIRPLNHDSFISSRCGEILVNGKSIGFFGEINPMVLENWRLEKSVIAFEIKLEDVYG